MALCFLLGVLVLLGALAHIFRAMGVHSIKFRLLVLDLLATKNSVEIKGELAESLSLTFS